jgi:hypothetical protein
VLKHAAAAAAITATMVLPCLAQTPGSSTRLRLAQTTATGSVKDANRNAKLADAASIAEDLIDLALDGKADKVAEKVSAMRKALATLRPLIADDGFATVEGQVTEMEQASAKNDAVGAALAAVEAYRIIEKATDAARGPVPLEVAMIDYAGFKLSLLVARPEPDWTAVAVTAREADGNWAALAKKIQDASLRDLGSAIQDGLRGAVERKDINGVKFAAKMQLGVVDVLEGYFKRIHKGEKHPAR